MRPALFYNRQGFTLVEGIVAGTLSIFTILTVTALYKMNADQISGSFVRSQTKMQYQTVIDQIGVKARRAQLLSPNRTTTSDTSTAAIYSDSLFLLDSNGNFGGYIRAGTSLIERTTSASYIPFKVGSKEVKVTNKGDGTDKPFEISPDRKSVQVKLNVFINDGPSKDTMYSRGESFECRN